MGNTESNTKSAPPPPKPSSEEQPPSTKEQYKIILSYTEYNTMKNELIELADLFIGGKNRISREDLVSRRSFSRCRGIKLVSGQQIIFQESKKISYWMLSILDNIGTITFGSVMGTDERTELSKKAYPVGPDGKRLKPCCACPETKRARDACVVEKGEENCTELIEAHKACMRSLGFNI